MPIPLGQRDPQFAIQIEGLDARNIRFVEEMLDVLGHSIESHHVGGSGHRNVVFDVWSGDVWLRHHEVTNTEAMSDG